MVDIGMIAKMARSRWITLKLNTALTSNRMAFASC